MLRLSLLLLCMTAAPAGAYVGPGVGLALLGPFFTLIALVAVALGTLLFFPLRRLWKRRKRRGK